MVPDLLLKNEAKSSDMIDIMNKMQQYYSDERRVAAGGDQVTCECQVASQHHMMCGNTPRERLEILEPQCEDWHCMVVILQVSVHLVPVKVHLQHNAGCMETTSC